MSEDSSEGLYSRLKNALRGAFYTHVPDHPSHGGNTGDAEWSPADAENAHEQADSEPEN